MSTRLVRLELSPELVLDRLESAMLISRLMSVSGSSEGAAISAATFAVNSYAKNDTYPNQ